MRESRVGAEVEDLVVAHMPLVGHVVRQTMGRVPRHIDPDELTSAGLAALLKAARAYDPDRGVPFAGYASTRIRGAILDELRSGDWASRSVRRVARDLDAARSQLASRLGRRPTDAEVAQAVGLSEQEIAANDEDVARAQVLSLQGLVDNLLEGPLSSTAPSPEQMFEHRERLEYLVEAIAELPERMRLVVQDYFFAERPMAEIAIDLGVTESRVSQIRAEAMVLLREVLTRELSPELVAPHARPDGRAARRCEAYCAAVAARHASRLRPSVARLAESA